jgi:8-oxo-dGTP pyrophosphatase MutT (NUDIX family)
MQNPQSINEVKIGEIEIFQTMTASGPVIIQERDGVLKTLLVKHGDKPIEELKWKFCGGKLLKGLGLEENAIREAQEEIGIEVKLIAPLIPMALWQEIPESGTEKPELFLLIHYLAEINNEPLQCPETLAMQWFDINNLPDNCVPNIKPVIEDYKQRYLNKEG